MGISCLLDPSHHPGSWLTHSNMTKRLYPIIPTQQHSAWGYAVCIYMCLCATFYALLNHSGAVVVSSGIIFIYVSLFYLNIWQWCSALMCALCFGKERSVYMCVGGSHFSIKGLPGKKTWHLWDKRRETDQKSMSERKKKQYQIFLNTQLEGFNFLWEPCVRDGRKAPPQPSL